MFTRKKNRSSYDLSVAVEDVHGSYILTDGIEVLEAPDGALAPESRSNCSSPSKTDSSHSRPVSTNGDNVSLLSEPCLDMGGYVSTSSRKSMTPNGSLQRKRRIRDNLNRLRQRKSSLSVLDTQPKNRYSLPTNLSSSKDRVSLRKRLSFRIFDKIVSDRNSKCTNHDENQQETKGVDAASEPESEHVDKSEFSEETENPEYPEKEELFLFCPKKSPSLLDEILAETNNLSLNDIKCTSDD